MTDKEKPSKEQIEAIIDRACEDHRVMGEMIEESHYGKIVLHNAIEESYKLGSKEGFKAGAKAERKNVIDSLRKHMKGKLKNEDLALDEMTDKQRMELIGEIINMLWTGELLEKKEAEIAELKKENEKQKWKIEELEKRPHWNFEGDKDKKIYDLGLANVELIADKVCLENEKKKLKEQLASEKELRESVASDKFWDELENREIDALWKEHQKANLIIEGTAKGIQLSRKEVKEKLRTAPENSNTSIKVNGTLTKEQANKVADEVLKEMGKRCPMCGLAPSYFHVNEREKIEHIVCRCGKIDNWYIEKIFHKAPEGKEGK